MTAEAARAGLCASCTWMAMVTSSKGSTFFMCRRSEFDADFPRYPPIPVRICRGYEPKEES